MGKGMLPLRRERSVAVRTLAAETDEAGCVERVVFLALRGGNRVECFWPVPLAPPATAVTEAAVQLRRLADDDHAGLGEAGQVSVEVRDRTSVV